MSRYAQRSILFSSELRSLKKGVAKNEFYYFPSYVAYAMDHVSGGAPPPGSTMGQVQVIDAGNPKPKPDRTLFVYQQIGPHTSRVVTAAQARLDGPDLSGKIVLNLNDFTSHTFADANPMAGAGSDRRPEHSEGPSGATINNDPLKAADSLKDSPPSA